jgi:sugar/nucleoside kinase (ribokinase family)
MKFPFELAPEKNFDAIGFGTNAVDFLIVVSEYPAFDSKIELRDYTQLAGGEIASAMCGLSRLGMKTAYLGRFGSDSAGEFGLQTLRDEKVNVEFAEQIAGARTQIAFIIIDEKSGERTVIWKRDRKLSYAESEAPVQAASLGKILHFTPHDARACIRMAREARAKRTITSIDIDNKFEGIEELLPLVDIFISSAEFPERFLGFGSREKALREIKSRYGCKIVGITLGESGSLILCEDEIIETKGYAVPGGAKDTTGAGDAFRAGFLFGLLKNESVETATEMANAVAALKCRKLGARTALPDENELRKFLQR